MPIPILTKLASPHHPADVIGEIHPNELRGLKVLFVNMPLRESALPDNTPEGPLILAAILRELGAEVTIMDLNAYRIQDEDATRRGLSNGRHKNLKEAEELLLAHLGKYGDQDLIALSGMITTLHWQEDMARMIRKWQPSAFLVSGGGLATEIKLGLFEWIPELDAIGDSEGDDIIITIARDVKTMKDLGRERAIRSGRISPYYLDGLGKFNYIGNRPRNLDLLPYPAYELLSSDVFGENILERYIQAAIWGIGANNSSAAPFTMTRSLNKVSSRGCPHACAFCYRGAQGERKWGMHSADYIARLLRRLIDTYEIDFLGIVDDNFAISKERCAELPSAFKAHGVNCRWGTHLRLDEADARLEPMAEAGCIYIGFGAESASATVLERMKKGGFILRPRGAKENQLVEVPINGHLWGFARTMKEGYENCIRLGIHGNCTWIAGYPGETKYDLQTSVAFILWQRDLVTRGLTPGSEQHTNMAQSVNEKMFTATAYPGTSMFKEEGVQRLLKLNFGIRFERQGLEWHPVCDEAFHRYVLELDDATKVLEGNSGEPLYFGEMPVDEFLQARGHIDSGHIERILDM